MKAVIIAGGKGTRMRPLTEDRPKQLVELKGRPILDHILEVLPEAISELIVVVGYRGEQIRAYYGDAYKGKPITYIVQEEQKGTWHALRLCKDYLYPGERFLVMYADDLHGRAGIERCIAAPGHALLASSVDHPERFGILEVTADSRIVGLEEKPQNPKTNLACTGVYILTPDIFKYHPPLRNGEEYLADSIAAMIADGHEVQAIEASFWFPIGYPEDVAKAERDIRPEDLL